jgi:hypothetical protein
MDDALRAPAGWRWITITALSIAPTFAHNLHSRHHYEYKPLKTKIQGRKGTLQASGVGTVRIPHGIMGYVES